MISYGMVAKKMLTSSAKAKGRRLQLWFRSLLIERLDLHEEDVQSTGMGQPGEDIQLARAAREKFPFSIEAKNQERLNVWAAWEQANANAGKYEPILVIKKNKIKPLVVVDAEVFVNMIGVSNAKKD